MDFLSKCLFNLHAIGEIPRGQRISTRGDCLSVERESYLQCMKRFADGRSKVFRDINRYISTVIEISTRLMESRYFIKDCIWEDGVGLVSTLAAGGNDNNVGAGVSNGSGVSNVSVSNVVSGSVVVSTAGTGAKKVNHDILKIRCARIDELRKIVSGLLEARRGIVGQQETYKDDTDVCVIILDLIARIDNHNAEIKKFLHSIGERIRISHDE